MDALELLTADHDRFRGLFARFKAAKEEADLDQMTAIATVMAKDLEVHTTIEEEVFYPATSDLSAEIHDTVTEGIEEHRVVNRLLDEVAAMVPDTEAWAAKVTVIIESTEHHADEEESEMFPKIRTATSADERARLGERLEAEKRALGAPTLADKIDLTRDELTTLAREQQIPGRSKMAKEQLAATVAPRGSA